MSVCPCNKYSIDGGTNPRPGSFYGGGAKSGTGAGMNAIDSTQGLIAQRNNNREIRRLSSLKSTHPNRSLSGKPLPFPCHPDQREGSAVLASATDLQEERGPSCSLNAPYAHIRFSLKISSLIRPASRKPLWINSPFILLYWSSCSRDQKARSVVVQCKGCGQVSALP